MRRNSFLSAPRIWVELIGRTARPIFVHMVQGRIGWAGYCSRQPDWCPRLTPHHRRRCRMLAHKHLNWNRQHWSRALFVDEYIVSISNCNGHVRVFRCLAEMLMDCYIQETDGIRQNDYQSGRDWSWAHNRKSHETNADRSSLGSCLSARVGGSDDEETVWGIVLDVLSGIQGPVSI